MQSRSRRESGSPKTEGACAGEVSMIVSASKLLATCAATALLAVALSACGGGGGSSSAVVVDPMPDPDPMAEPPEMEPDDVTQPPIMVDYSQPSHDLQASLARTNWLTFRHQSGGGSDIAYGDFDGDGDEDVFLLSPGTDAEGEPSVCFPDPYCFTRAIPVEIWENIDNRFVLNTQKFFSGNVPEVASNRKTLIGDFNGDGKPDIFLATHGPAAPPLPREEPPALFLSTEPLAK